MKKIIRTIISYYNGERFIEEQVNSILQQADIKSYESQIFIYDDGSNNESYKKLINMFLDKPNIRIMRDGKNFGVYRRYLTAWADAVFDNVDYVFFADQDDYFLPDKYVTHINAHATLEKSFVISGERKWYFNENLFKDKHKNCNGLNFSFDVARINKILQFDIDVFKENLSSSQSDLISYFYHDSLLMVLFTALDEVATLWSKRLAWHRIHENSITNSGENNKRPYMYWSDQYSAYFFGYKQFFDRVFNIKLSVSKFNKKYYITDPSSKSKYNVGSFLKWKLDNFSMYLHLKWARNFIRNYLSKKWVSDKKEYFLAKKKYKEFYKINKNKYKKAN